jgi:glucoamylase
MESRTELALWIADQAQRSAIAMETAISATGLTRHRDAFGQVIVPARGSVLASPVIGDWNPVPDYFFHWVRDAAAVMCATVDLMQAASSRNDRERWRRHFNDIVRFSLTLSTLDGASGLRQTDYRRATRGGLLKYLRPLAEFRALNGEKLLGEPRFNPDGTIDIFRWSRPQYDGPALRALACLRYLAAGGRHTDSLDRLLRQDLNFTLRHAGQSCVGPWEEGKAHHYYVALVQLGAVVRGQAFIEDAKMRSRVEQRLRARLNRHWSDKHQVYTAIWPIGVQNTDDLIDGAQLLAILDSDLPDGPHSVEDERAHKTQGAIERLFSRVFPINCMQPAPALGRYNGDRYFGGGAWYPITLAAASLSYRLGQCAGQERTTAIRRGDAFMATIRALTPADGVLSEQVDKFTARQTSAPHLTWSYAAFVMAAASRVRCMDRR